MIDFFNKNVRKCWSCDKFPHLIFPIIEIKSQKNLKIIEKNAGRTGCRIGCCNIFYEGRLNQLRLIVKAWNSHTRELNNEIEENKKKSGLNTVIIT